MDITRIIEILARSFAFLTIAVRRTVGWRDTDPEVADVTYLALALERCADGLDVLGHHFLIGKAQHSKRRTPLRVNIANPRLVHRVPFWMLFGVLLGLQWMGEIAIPRRRVHSLNTSIQGMFTETNAQRPLLVDLAILSAN